MNTATYSFTDRNTFARARVAPPAVLTRSPDLFGVHYNGVPLVEDGRAVEHLSELAAWRRIRALAAAANTSERCFDVVGVWL